jgi:DNA polymerase (family 10)
VIDAVELAIRPDGSLDGDADGAELAIGIIRDAFELPLEAQTARLVKAIESGAIDLLAHPTGRLLEQRPPISVDVEAIARAAARAGVALEIDGAPDKLDPADDLIRIARQAGAYLAIDSDARAPQQLAWLGGGVDLARRAWVAPTEVLNTRSAESLLEFRKTRNS